MSKQVERGTENAILREVFETLSRGPFAYGKLQTEWGITEHLIGIGFDKKAIRKCMTLVKESGLMGSREVLVGKFVKETANQVMKIRDGRFFTIESAEIPSRFREMVFMREMPTISGIFDSDYLAYLYEKMSNSKTSAERQEIEQKAREYRIKGAISYTRLIEKNKSPEIAPPLNPIEFR